MRYWLPAAAYVEVRPEREPPPAAIDRPFHPDKLAAQARVLAAIAARPGLTRRRLAAEVRGAGGPKYLARLADDLVRQGLVRSTLGARSGTACVRYTVAA